MGDPYILMWQADQRFYDPGARDLWAQDPVTRERCDLSLTTYAKDLVKLLSVAGSAAGDGPPMGELAELSALAAVSNSSLDERLRDSLYGQNRSKQVAIVSLPGKGSLRGRQLLRRIGGGLASEAADCARSLGAQVHHLDGAERRARKMATPAAFFSLRRFWHASDVPWRWRHALFLCKVVNTALANVEAFCPSPAELGQLTMLAAYLGRRATSGAACTKGKDGQQVAMDPEAVLRHWRVCPMDLDARLRRLRWYQSMALYPSQYVQVLAAMFGCARCDSQPMLDQQGRVVSSANPWAHQAWADIYAMCSSLESAAPLQNMAGGSILAFFRLGEIRDLFVRLDLAELRSAYLSRRVPSQWTAAAAAEEHYVQGEDVREVPGGWVCSVEGCGWLSETRHSCILHLAGAHGLRHLASVAAVVNKCPICMQGFSCVDSAARHLSRALVVGRCPRAAARSLAPLSVPGTLECPLCDWEAGSLQELQGHIRAGLRPAPCSPSLRRGWGRSRLWAGQTGGCGSAASRARALARARRGVRTMP